MAFFHPYGDAVHLSRCLSYSGAAKGLSVPRQRPGLNPCNSGDCHVSPITCNLNFFEI